MWKCLNCTYLKHTPYICWHNGPDYPPDENLETLSCSKNLFSPLDDLDTERFKKVVKIGDDCKSFEERKGE